jgi:hypothetical protein
LPSAEWCGPAPTPAARARTRAATRTHAREQATQTTFGAGAGRGSERAVRAGCGGPYRGGPFAAIWLPVFRSPCAHVTCSWRLASVTPFSPAIAALAISSESNLT